MHLYFPRGKCIYIFPEGNSSIFQCILGSVFLEGNAFIFSQREMHLYFNALWDLFSQGEMHLYFNALKYRYISLLENIDAFPFRKTDPTMHWNIDSSWICSPRAPEVDLIKAVNMSPWHYTIFVVYKIKCCFIDRHVVFIYQLHTLSSLRLRNEPPGPMNRALCETRFYVWIFFEKQNALT